MKFKEKLKESWEDLWVTTPAIGMGAPLSPGFILSGFLTFGVICGAMTYYFSKKEEKLKEDFSRSQLPVAAIVLSEKYTPSDCCNNESKYSLVIKTDKGKEIQLCINDGLKAKKESLDSLINKGSKISFPTGNIAYSPEIRQKSYAEIKNFYEYTFRDYYKAKDETYFAENTPLGKKCADRIRILKK